MKPHTAEFASNACQLAMIKKTCKTHGAFPRYLKLERQLYDVTKQRMEDPRSLYGMGDSLFGQVVDPKSAYFSRDHQDIQTFVAEKTWGDK